MNRTEFYNWFNEQVSTRWPKWETNGCILADWFSAFGGYPQDILTKSIQKHKIYDDPPAPSTKRLLDIVKKMQPRSPAAPYEFDKPADAITFSRFREKVLTSYTKEQRIRLMRSLIKFYPKAKDFDSEAYEWVTGQRNDF
jgi:hypothetical protein